MFGAVYEVGTSPGGAWSTYTAGTLVGWLRMGPGYTTLAWTNLIPKKGWVAYNDTDGLIYYKSTNDGWERVGGGTAGSSSYRGDWAAGTYSATDYVKYNSNFYIALNDIPATNTFNPDQAADWLLLTAPATGGRDFQGTWSPKVYGRGRVCLLYTSPSPRD